MAACAAAIIIMWLLVPPSHDIPAALQASSAFLSAQRATAAALTDPTMLVPDAFSKVNKDAINLALARSHVLEQFPWLSAAPTGSASDAVQGGFYMGRQMLLPDSQLLI